jgi:hypothetical protein
MHICTVTDQYFTLLHLFLLFIIETLSPQAPELFGSSRRHPKANLLNRPHPIVIFLKPVTQHTPIKITQGIPGKRRADSDRDSLYDRS